IDDLAVDGHCSIRYTHDQFALDHAGQRQLIDHFGGGRKNLATEFYLTRAQSAPLAQIATPAEEEAHQLPHGIETQAARHNRIFGEVAVEEPQPRVDVEFGNDLAFTMGAARVVDLDDAVHHQHVANGKPGIARAEHAAIATIQ